MGVNTLWKLLAAEQIVVKRTGSSPEDYPSIVSEVDGKAVAVDLAMWVMQAGQQQVLATHFSQQESAIKVAFERALQWLRHGCLPVIVVEGRPPEEKREAQQQRFAQRMGYAGGGGRGGAQFTALGRLVASVLEEMGLPVFYAPGEAEAVCAALAQAGSVDAAATFDSDVLLYGAEAVYQTLKLSTTQPGVCELTKCSMADVRSRLGISAGGSGALSVVAMLAGSDYDLEGAHGVGSIGGLAVARHLLQDDQDDSRLLERLAALLRRPPDAHLLSIEKCTGCATCRHEGGRKGKIKRHTAQNPCTHCPPSQDGCCTAPPPGSAPQRCTCAFHALESKRQVERIAERARRDPGFVQKVEASLSVFERQGREAAEYVVGRLQELGQPLGRRLGWLHRPSVSGVWSIVTQRCPSLLWDMSTLRSKMLPALMEWDLAAASMGQQVEWRPVEIQKVHGQVGKKGGEGAGGGDGGGHWRYVLRWERTAQDMEGLGVLQVHPKRPRAKPSSGEGDEEDLPVSQHQQPLSQQSTGPLLLSQQSNQSQRQLLSQQSPSKGGGLSQQSPGKGGGLSQQSWGMDLRTQPFTPEGASQEQPTEPMTVRQFDERWLKEQPAERRAVRQSAVQMLCPRLVEAYKDKLAAAAAPKRSKASVAVAGAKPGGGAGRKKGGSKAADAVAGSGDVVQLFSQAAAASAAEAAAAAHKKAAPPPRRYGLAEQRPDSPAAPRPSHILDDDASTAGAAAAAAAAWPRAAAAAAKGSTEGAGAGQQRGRTFAVESPSLALPHSANSIVALLEQALGPATGPPAAPRAAGSVSGWQAGPPASQARPAVAAAAAPSAPIALGAGGAARAGEGGFQPNRTQPTALSQQQQHGQQQQQQGGGKGEEPEQGQGGSWWKGEGLVVFESPSKRRKPKSPPRSSPSDRGSDGFEVLLSSPGSPNFSLGAHRPAGIAAAAGAASRTGMASRHVFGAGPSDDGGGAAAVAHGQEPAEAQLPVGGPGHEEESGREVEQEGPRAEGPMLQHWQQPGGAHNRRARVRSRRGRGGGAHGAAAGGRGRTSAGESEGGDAGQQPQPQPARKPARRGKAGLQAAAKVHAGDIRGFLTHHHHHQQSRKFSVDGLNTCPTSRGLGPSRPAAPAGGMISDASEDPSAWLSGSEDGPLGGARATGPTCAAAGKPQPSKAGSGAAPGPSQHVPGWDRGAAGMTHSSRGSDSEPRKDTEEEPTTPRGLGPRAQAEVISLLTPSGPGPQPKPPGAAGAGPQRAQQQLQGPRLQGLQLGQGQAENDFIDLTWDGS